MPEYRFEVDWDRIRRGVPMDLGACPMALAIAEAIPDARVVEVDAEHLWFEVGEERVRYFRYLTLEEQRFVTRFDRLSGEHAEDHLLRGDAEYEKEGLRPFTFLVGDEHEMRPWDCPIAEDGKRRIIKLLHVKLSMDHIRRGRPGGVTTCPLELALMDAVTNASGAAVTYDYGLIFRKDAPTVYFTLSREQVEFARNFDRLPYDHAAMFSEEDYKEHGVVPFESTIDEMEGECVLNPSI